MFLRWRSAVPFTVEEWTGINLLSEDYAFRVLGTLLGMNAWMVATYIALSALLFVGGLVNLNG